MSNKLRDVPRFLNGGAVVELAVWQDLAKRRVPAFFEEEFRGRLENALHCFGFVRVVRTGFGTGFVAACSCKGRDRCPYRPAIQESVALRG